MIKRIQQDAFTYKIRIINITATITETIKQNVMTSM
jgi:hypothetical protein